MLPPSNDHSFLLAGMAAFIVAVSGAVIVALIYSLED